MTSKKGPTSQSQGNDTGDRRLMPEREDQTLQKITSIWTNEALDAPFDTADFDKKMQQLFSDEYYEEANLEDEMAYLDAELDNEDGLKGTNTTNALHEDEPSKGDITQPGLHDLFLEPDLFNTGSLEDAKRIAHQQGDPDAADLLADEPDPLLRELGAIDHEDIDNIKEDLLYPSEFSRRHVGNSASPTSKKGKADEPPENRNEALLSRLKDELQQKEDEYNKLHYDAKIAGGEVATRFRYREVPAEDFTLSVEEILCRDDRQLNMLAPMNCYAAYLDKRSNERDRGRIERRRRKGIREIDPSRPSRHYHDVSRTIVLNPNMSEDEGMKVVERLRKRLREDEDENNDPNHNNNNNKRLETTQKPRGGGPQGERPPQAGRGSGRSRSAYSSNPRHDVSHYNGDQPNTKKFHRENRGGRGRGGFVPPFRGGRR
ncbi:unnamed protein product [Phytomonas sp. Hart1]|nr:unnamed protein product [Phytomonas sp. Hart1]|eukprot:CCW71929.1 unnamed protein product [Phytomonas sp. isolate Hart1]